MNTFVVYSDQQMHVQAWFECKEKWSVHSYVSLTWPTLLYAWWKKYVFDNFRAFFIVFDHANACPRMQLLVEIHNTRLTFNRRNGLKNKSMARIFSFEIWGIVTCTNKSSSSLHDVLILGRDEKVCLRSTVDERWLSTSTPWKPQCGHCIY